MDPLSACDGLGWTLGMNGALRVVERASQDARAPEDSPSFDGGEIMMAISKRFVLLPTTVLACIPIADCISTTSGISEATQGCPEIDAGADAAASAVTVDTKVRAFMEASIDLRAVAAVVKPAVKAACVGIAKDLGAHDTWTALGDVDDAMSNAKGTGACDTARRSIVAILTAHSNTAFALVVSRGACVPDFRAEAACEAGCAGSAKCDPGTVETRCDPAQLSVVCNGACGVQGLCEGRADAETNCEGQCEAECSGSCSGTCIDERGTRTDNDSNCHGKCTSHCSGKCNGRCRVDSAAGVECGANVFCKAGCTSTFTSPRCETEFTPPKCSIDESCFESCRAKTVANAVCDPPTVKLLADSSAGADVAALVTTINKNLPPLIEVGESQGRMAVDILQDVSSSGEAVLNSSGNLDGRSVACATAAASSFTKAAGTLNVATQAGTQVAQDCSSHSQ
jgi:hypothetical protein